MAELLANAWRLIMSGSFVEVLVATFVGSLVGGAAAFNAERRKREEDKSEERRAAVGRTLFRLYRYRQIVEFIYTHEVVPMKESTAGVYASRPWLDTGWHALPLELSGIEFLFATEHATVLVELLEREEEFGNLTAMVRQRSATMRNVVTPIADKHPMRAPDDSPGFDLKAVIAELTASQRFEIEDVARQIEETTAAERAFIPKAMKRLAAVQRALWPKHKVQYIDVIEGQKREDHGATDQPSKVDPAQLGDDAIAIRVRTHKAIHEAFVTLLRESKLKYQVVQPPLNTAVASGFQVVVSSIGTNGAQFFTILAGLLKQFLAGSSSRICVITMHDFTIVRPEEFDVDALARCLVSARDVMIADTRMSDAPQL